MKLISLLSAQKTSVLRAVPLFGLASLLLLIVAFQPFVPVSVLTKDAIVVAKGKFYYGAISNIGILLWAASATICLSTFVLLQKFKAKQTGYFFLYCGTVTLFLLCDDFFLMHEVVFPNYLGINEKVVLAVYPISIIILFLRFHGTVARTPFLVLLTSVGFLALSNVVDILLAKTTNIHLIFEDGAKFIGIVGWAIYFFDTAFRLLKDELDNHDRLKLTYLLNQNNTAPLAVEKDTINLLSEGEQD